MTKILVITVRGLHAGYLGCYGNEWIETPTIDSLASEGVVFDQHFVNHPEASAAQLSWRTGTYQLPSLSGSNPTQPRPDLLAILRQAGIATQLVMYPNHLWPRELWQGWDRVTAAKAETPDAALEATLSAAVQALDGLFAKDNWLVWVDLATLLPPWQVPNEYVAPYFEVEVDDDEDADEEETDEPLQPLFDPRPGPLPVGDDKMVKRLQYSYASAVTFLDAGLEALIEELGNLGLGDEIVFLLTSDHGLPLGEHGVFGLHRPWLHDELIHVPLLLSLPHSSDDVGRRVPALTQSCDLMPTVLDLFGQPIPADVQGRSLVPLARGQVKQVRPHAVSGLELNGLEYALRTTNWAYLLPIRVPDGDPPRLPQLYAKPEDRWEANNLIQHHPELAEQFDQTLRKETET